MFNWSQRNSSHGQCRHAKRSCIGRGPLCQDAGRMNPVSKPPSLRTQFMNGITRARLVVLGLALIGTVMLGQAVPARAATQEVASVQQLKAEAAQAIRDGRFARTNELLAKAAELSHSHSDELAAQWTRHFEDQRHEFDVERQQQCDKATANVKILLNKGHFDYAIEIG